MDRRIRSWVLALTLVVPAAVAAPKEMSIQVREGKLRDKPSFLGGVTATLSYGARVTVLESKDPWSRVGTEDDSASGWIHTSALTKRRIKLKAGEKDAEVAASSGELALAGKGFNSEVEAQFKSRNKDVDYTWVDKMEKMVVPVQECRTFLAAGDVTAAAGGDQ